MLLQNNALERDLHLAMGFGKSTLLSEPTNP